MYLIYRRDGVYLMSEAVLSESIWKEVNYVNQKKRPSAGQMWGLKHCGEIYPVLVTAVNGDRISILMADYNRIADRHKIIYNASYEEYTVYESELVPLNG